VTIEAAVSGGACLVAESQEDIPCKKEPARRERNTGAVRWLEDEGSELHLP
jgi:hypothetical protein